jgi:hypothetical protein
VLAHLGCIELLEKFDLQGWSHSTYSWARLSLTEIAKTSLVIFSVLLSRCDFSALSTKTQSFHACEFSNEAQASQSVSILGKNRLPVRLIGRDSSQRASHVRVENIQSVDIASINPTESVASPLA